MRYNIVIPILYYNIERFDGKKILLFINWSDLKFLLFKEQQIIHQNYLNV